MSTTTIQVPPVNVEVRINHGTSLLDNTVYLFKIQTHRQSQAIQGHRLVCIESIHLQTLAEQTDMIYTTVVL